MSVFFQEFRLKHYAGDVTYCVNGELRLNTSANAGMFNLSSCV